MDSRARSVGGASGHESAHFSGHAVALLYRATAWSRVARAVSSVAKTAEPTTSAVRHGAAPLYDQTTALHVHRRRHANDAHQPAATARAQPPVARVAPRRQTAIASQRTRSTISTSSVELSRSVMERSSANRRTVMTTASASTSRMARSTRRKRGAGARVPSAALSSGSRGAPALTGMTTGFELGMNFRVVEGARDSAGSRRDIAELAGMRRCAAD